MSAQAFAAMLTAPSPLPPFALAAPDLAPWRAGNTGVPGVWHFAAAAPGRHALLTALVHGNELCGAWAAIHVLQMLAAGQRVRRGRLTVMLCNLDAFDRFDAAHPDDSRFVDQDLNRLWGNALTAAPLDGSLEQRRARQLAPWVEQADDLLDLHSMHEIGPPMALVGTAQRHARFAQALQIPGLMVADPGHAAGKRLRDHGRFGLADGADDSRAVLVECGWHGDVASRTLAEALTLRFLVTTGVWDADAPNAHPAHTAPQNPAHRLVRVTHAVTVQAGPPPALAQAWPNGHTVPQAGTLIGTSGGQLVVTPYDDCVLVMPTLRHATEGATLVRLGRWEPIG